MDLTSLYGLGLLILFVGIIIVMIAILLSTLSRSKGEVKGGGAIIIGPIPIVFGTDKKSLQTVLLLSIVLTVILVVATIILNSTNR
jgi:uncharacterized protein (TIGR00304 family)